MDLVTWEVNIWLHTPPEKAFSYAKICQCHVTQAIKNPNQEVQ